MITLQSLSGQFNRGILEIVGLSTDTKPIESIEGQVIVNGSYFYEMDTKTMYMYDAQNKQWLGQ